MNKSLSQLIGYVSDENYVALPDALLEFQNGGASIETRSRATGAIYANVEPGVYQVTICKSGYGSKHVEVSVGEGQPYQFRLLSDQMTGYVWPKWVRSGESSEIRFHSVEDYVLELWRYGWRKEFVQSVGVFGEHGPRPRMQITPDGDYSQTGVNWNQVGYQGRSVINTIEAPSRSGLYYLHARTPSGDFFAAPWIVAPEKPTAEIAVLASNINWNAYNNFGGRSNYIQAGGLRPVPTVNARQDLHRYTDPTGIFYDSDEYPPLSFERPERINHIDYSESITDPIRGRNQCHCAPAEWRLLGWLEREGFDYDLYAETQFHFGQLNLDDYKLVILSTHPEYWSREMYDRLKQWVFERGGRLMYLGGNGLNCEVSFLNESRMVVHNGNQRTSNADDFESRFHQRYESEANLLGVVFSFAGAMTGAPYRVVDASHWALHGTELKNGDLFGTRSLHLRCPGGASGHETDKISPQFSHDNVHLIAQGTNPDNGGADMIHFTTSSGGEVFSAGSIAYPSSIVIDESISQVTMNVLNRFLK
jgi:N,N-dimethylformamidase